MVSGVMKEGGANRDEKRGDETRQDKTRQDKRGIEREEKETRKGMLTYGME